MISKRHHRVRLLPHMLAAIVVAMVGDVVGGQAAATLPSLTLANAAGTPVSTDALVRPTSWVLVVAPGSCPSCAGLFAALDSALPAERMSRLVVAMVGGTPAQVLAVRPKYVRLRDAEWVLDPSRQLLPALGVSTSPLVVGLRDARIQWMRSTAGLPFAQVQALAEQWVREP